MDEFVKSMIENNTREAADEYMRRKRLDPNYKPPVPKKLILWFGGLVAAFGGTVLILYLVHQYA